jgi:DNA polymerase delta subunit 2
MIATSNAEYPTPDRLPSSYNPLNTFELAKGSQKHYQQQYGDMYFLRLAKLKPVIERYAAEAWDGFEVWVPKRRLARC